MGKVAVNAVIEANDIVIPAAIGSTSGIYASSLMRPKIVNNHIMSDGSALFGIYLPGTGEALIAGNDIHGFQFGVLAERYYGSPENYEVKQMYSEGHKISGNYIQNSDYGVILYSGARDNKVQGNVIEGSSNFDYVLFGESPLGPYRMGPASGNQIKFTGGTATVLDISGCSNVDSCPQLDQDSDGVFDEDPINGIDDDLDGLIDEDPEDFLNMLPD